MARVDGGMSRAGVASDNISSDVWADTACRSRSDEAWLRTIGRDGRVHRKKPEGRAMSQRAFGFDAERSAVLARVEHVSARQKDQMGGACKVPAMRSIVRKQVKGCSPHHRQRQGRGEDNARQPRLRQRPPDLP